MDLGDFIIFFPYIVQVIVIAIVLWAVQPFAIALLCLAGIFGGIALAVYIWVRTANREHHASMYAGFTIFFPCLFWCGLALGIFLIVSAATMLAAI